MLTKSEFRGLFTEMGKTHKISGMSTYVNTVVDDYNNYVRNFERFQGQVNEILPTQRKYIPNKYTTCIFEYLVLYYFDQFFLRVSKMNIDICDEFLKYKEINTVSIVKNKKISENIEVSEQARQKYLEDYQNLERLFDEVGKALLPDVFNKVDFLNDFFNDSLPNSVPVE